MKPQKTGGNHYRLQRQRNKKENPNKSEIPKVNLFIKNTTQKLQVYSYYSGTISPTKAT